jgi:exopolysaccharide biosynthesis polyprenyl glycosylphosphotransferase
LARRTHTAFRVTAFAGDLVLAATALWCAFALRARVPLPGTEGLLPPGRIRFTPSNVLLVCGAQVLALSLFGLYGSRERFREPLARLMVPALFFQLLALSSVYFLALNQESAFPRSVLILYVLIDAPLVAAWRALLDRLFPQPQRRAVIVGVGAAAGLIADAIGRHPWTGVEVAGVVGEGSSPREDLRLLGPIERLTEILVREKVDEVILTPEAAAWRERISQSMPAGGAVDLLVWPSPFETMIGRLRFRIVGDLPLLEAQIRPFEGVAALVKRAFDIIVAALLLLLSLPLLLVSVAVVALSSRGGVFFRQTRVGKDGRPFRVWKLRTMVESAEAETGAVLAAVNDPRVTKVGRWLRAGRLDEIPQLINVLLGDMSLVGPRPERPEFTERFARSVPGYALRHSARPGLTGLAQVSGDYSTQPEIKLRYDLAYLNNWSLALDVSILLRTLPVILTRRGV